MAKVRIYSTPPYLYRYRRLTDQTIERELDAVSGAYIYCPRFSDMNDPMEGAHRFSIGSVLRGPKETQEQVAIAREQLGIAALSEVHDHEPMWAHYAGHFAGLCIMFSTRKLLAGLADDIDLIRMAYNEKPPTLLSSKSSVIEKAKLTLATKTVRWSSEREWRVIAPSVGRAEYRDPGVAMRIYLGSRIEDGHEQRIRLAMKALKIPVVKMRIDKYAIEFSGSGS
jgi:hypothetical protein